MAKPAATAASAVASGGAAAMGDGAGSGVGARMESGGGARVVGAGARVFFTPPILEAAPYFFFCAFYLYAMITNKGLMTCATLKILPLLFLVLVLSQFGMMYVGSQRKYSTLLTVGLIFSMAGDVAIELAQVDFPNHFFVFGLALFLIAHVFYTAAFCCGDNGYRLPYALFMYVIAAIMFYVLLDGTKSLTAPVAGYCLVLGTMAYRALARIGSPSSIGFSQGTAAVGALLFVVSDSVLAMNKFTKIAIPHPLIIIMVTYYMSQLLIVFSCYGGFVIKPGDKAATTGNRIGGDEVTAPVATEDSGGAPVSTDPETKKKQ